jgi:hypothetical protein
MTNDFACPRDIGDEFGAPVRARIPFARIQGIVLCLPQPHTRTSGTAAPVGPGFVPGFCHYNDRVFRGCFDPAHGLSVKRGQPTRQETPYAIARDVSAETRGMSALVLTRGSSAARPSTNVDMDPPET